MSESSLLGVGKLKKQDTASLISALVSQHRAITESAAKAAELKANAVDIDVQLANISDSTLHEAIENDRRLTTRNIVRWIDLVAAAIINCHKAFVSPGKFTAEDIVLGNKQALSNTSTFTEKSISRMKTDQEYLSLTDEQTIESNMLSNSTEGDRLAALDFLRRTLLYRKSIERPGTAAEPADLPDWMPRGFQSATLTRFDHRHDGNIAIPTSHGLHDAVVKAYRAFGRAVWQDLRCLGIIILQIYTLSVFRQEEVDSLMHWPVPVVAEKEESSDEEGAPLGGVSLKTMSTVGNTTAGPAPKKGGKAAVIGTGLQSKTQPLALVTKRSSSPTHSSTVAKPSLTDGKSKRAEVTKTAAGPGSLASGSVSELKPSGPREPHLPSALELSLLPSYPCIERMPGPVKDLLLNVCFTRAQEAVVEVQVRHRGEDCDRLECPLLAMLRQARRDLHELAEKLDADSHYVAPNIWTEADERARLAAHRERRDRMAEKAEHGPAKAEARLQHERYLLWYSMQSEDFRERLEARKKARKRAERHTFMRRKYIYQASFHRWNMVNFAAWLQEAVLDYCAMLLELRTSAMQAKKKQKKNPAVYVSRLINDLQAVFAPTAINKLAAYREKRIDSEGEQFERALALVRPSTSGGDRRALAVTELLSLGLLKEGRASTSRGSDLHSDSIVVQTEPAASTALTTLPAIHSTVDKQQHQQQRAEQRSRQRRAVSASKDKTVIVKEPSQAEILSECFATMAAVLSRLLLRKQRDPMALCATMRQAVAAQEKESAEAVSERVLVTSEQQLYFKRLYIEAGHFSALNKQLRHCLVDFCDDIELLDRGWIKYLQHLLSSAIMHQFHTYAIHRNKGEMYAADRLIAFFRKIVVRNIVSRVWQRTNALLAVSHSPASSSRCGSKQTTPAQSWRKQMGLASRSHDTKDSRDTREGSRYRARTESNTDLSLAPSIPSLPAVRPRNAERRKPLCFRSVEAPTARSMRIDLNVSIDSDDHHDSIAVDDRDGQKALARLAKRYEDWRNVCCVAYIETDYSEEPAEVVSKQGPADTGMFVADTLQQQPQQQQQESTAHARVRNIEQPVKRRLVICLSAPEKKRIFETESAKIVNALQSVDDTFKKETAKVAIDVSDGIPDEAIPQGQDTVPPFLIGTNSGVGIGVRYGGLVASDDAWDDRSIESLVRPVKGLRPGSSLPAPPSSQPVAHTVVSYRIQLDDLPAFSCYSLRLEFDKTLADDLREGNKTYFRYISLLDDNDDLSLGSGDSLREVRFAEVGKQWGIKVEETIEINSTDGASIEAFSGQEVLTVELEQYVYTRAGPPRTVKGLTAKVAYNSADLSMLLAKENAASLLSTPHSHCPRSTALVQFLPTCAPDPLLSVGQSTAALSGPDPSPAVCDTVQGCTLLHWRHSIDDSHTNTHYEVQRRLLLICAASPVRVSLSPAQAVRSRPHSRDNRQPLYSEEQPFTTKSADEVIYAGPWRHVAGLKSLLQDPRKTASIKKVSRRTAAGAKESTTAAWSFPLHGNSCTDKVSLPEELDSNPDAYNCVVGYLCACFPDLVLTAATGKGVSQSAAGHSQSLSPEDCHSLSYPSSSRSATAEEDIPVLQSIVRSELRLAFEYRVRAVNSTGPGKFNAVSAVTSLQYMLSDGRKPVRLCVAPIAQVCCYLASLRDFRAQHPKYRSHNADLVGSVLAQRAEESREQGESFEVEPSGDPFVGYLVAVKDEALGIATARHPQQEEQLQLEGGAAEDEESTQINSWLRALELECPL